MDITSKFQTEKMSTAGAQRKVTVDRVLKMCGECNSRSFATNYKKLLRIMQKGENPPQIKLVIGDYLFKKVHLMFRPAAKDTEVLCAQLGGAISEMKNVVLRGSYLGYRNHAALTTICEAFFRARHDETYFIIQMLNDQTLIRANDSVATKEHFLSWLESAPTLEQKSNLLDVLLRNFGAQDKQIKKVYDEMRFSSEKKDIYSDGQNAHNDVIQDESVRNGILLLEDVAIHSGDTDRNSEIMYETLNAWYNIDDPAVREVYERIKIDHTTFGLGSKLFRLQELLYGAIVYISMAETDLAAALKVRLYEEIQEMAKLCASAYVVRIMNIFRGYVDRYECNLDFAEQLYSVISNRLSARMNEPNVSESVIYGTYDPEYEQDYIDFVLAICKQGYESWCSDYGRADMRATIIPVLERILENKKIVIEWSGDKLESIIAHRIIG